MFLFSISNTWKPQEDGDIDFFFLLMNELLLVIKINEGSEVESMLQAIQEIVYQTVFDKKKAYGLQLTC